MDFDSSDVTVACPNPWKKTRRVRLPAMPSVRVPRPRFGPRAQSLVLALTATSPLLVLAGFALAAAFRTPVDVDPKKDPPKTVQAAPYVEVSSPWTRAEAYAVAHSKPDSAQLQRERGSGATSWINGLIGASSKPTSLTEPPSLAAPSPSTGEGHSNLVWPIDSTYITSDFGNRADPVHGLNREHEGVDIRADEGTPVVSAAKGTVVAAEHSARSGLYVKVHHGGETFTIYAHLSSLAVTPRQEVQAGELLGYSGSTGRVTGPHLHFEVTENGVSQDPLSFDWMLTPGTLKSELAQQAL